MLGPCSYPDEDEGGLSYSTTSTVIMLLCIGGEDDSPDA